MFDMNTLDVNGAVAVRLQGGDKAYIVYHEKTLAVGRRWLGYRWDGEVMSFDEQGVGDKGQNIIGEWGIHENQSDNT